MIVGCVTPAIIISNALATLCQLFPPAVTIIFGKSPVVIATIMAVVLNIILPKE